MSLIRNVVNQVTGRARRGGAVGGRPAAGRGVGGGLGRSTRSQDEAIGRGVRSLLGRARRR
jgi:hypothetical protein